MEAGVSIPPGFREVTSSTGAFEIEARFLSPIPTSSHLYPRLFITNRACFLPRLPVVCILGCCERV